MTSLNSIALAPDGASGAGKVSRRGSDSLQHLVKRLRGGIVLVASPAGGIGGIQIDRDLKATAVLMMEAADEIERLRGANDLVI